MKRAVFALGATLLTFSAADAQQQLQWKQVTNLQKGLNIPQGVKLDILGIELGDTYAQAKAKLQALAAENGTPASAPKPKTASDLMNQSLDQMSGVENRLPLDERKTTVRYPLPGSTITAEFVGAISLRRELPNGNSKIIENIYVLLSAPSSGAQVYAIRRTLAYGDGDQPRISEMLNALSAKIGTGLPQSVVVPNQFRYQFDNGRMVPATTDAHCDVEFTPDTRSAARSINSTGTCDISMAANFSYGISRDHASSVNFFLSDQERAKANKETDYAFIESYVRGLQQSGAAPPKL